MAFKFVILALTLAYANAGNLIAEPAHAVHYSSAPAVSSSYFNQASAPVAHAKTLAVATPAYASAPAYAYQAAPAVAYQSAPHAVAYQTAPQHAVAYQTAPHAVAVHAPSVGYSQQAVSKSLGGAQSVSTYSKAVDSAFSSVRKYDTRITNDGVSYAPAQLAYSAPLVTKAYAAPVAYTAQAPVAYAAHSPVAYAAQSPVAYTSHAPVVTKTYAAPQVYSYGAPIAKAVAPVATYAAHAPVHYAAAPAVSYGAPAQLVTKSAVSYAPAVAHTTFQGYGVEYHY